MHHLHREKLYSLFEDNQDGIAYLKGAEVMYRYGTDYEFPFRQESNFWYLTGVNEPDFHMLMDLSNGEYHLFAPKRDEQFAVWHGFIKSQDTYQTEYEPDHLHYDKDLPGVLKKLEPSKIYCLDDEQAEFVEGLYKDAEVDTESLVDAITYCRSIKTEWELEQMREASRINSIAHRETLKALEPGIYEYEMKAIFDYHNIRHGLQQEAYTGIHAGGKNSAILHYVENNKRIEDGDLYLIDAGYEYNGYASDFTRTYPANGKFTKTQAQIYQIVLDAHKAVIEASKPGIKWEDMHLLSARIILEGLKEMDLVKGEVDELMDKNIFALFYPHGLGHFLGLDTHDVGGYPKGVDRIERPGLKYLRVRRTLEPGMVLTVEPGLYLIPALLEQALENEEQTKYLNNEKLRKLFDFGGVRIEDDIIITEDGCESITDVPKEIDEIEEIMASS